MGGGSHTTTTNQQTVQEIPREIRERGTAITNAAMGSYMPGGRNAQLPQYNPYEGQTEVAGFARTATPNYYHNLAGGKVQSAQNNYQPYFNNAQNAASNAFGQIGANNTGAPVYASTGAQYAPDGSAQFAEFNANNIQRFQDPFNQQVTQSGLSELQRQHDLAQNQINDAQAKSRSYGGARHGVAQAETTRNFLDKGNQFLADSLQRGYDAATGQYNRERDALFQQTQLNNAIGNQLFGQYNTAAQTLGNLGTAQLGADLQAAQGALGLGQQLQQTEQGALDRGYEEYQKVLNFPMEMGRELAAMNAAQPTNRMSTSWAQTTQPAPSPLSGLLGGIGQVAPLVFRSDERLKTDKRNVSAERVLKGFRKLRPKSYRYKDETALPHEKGGRRTGFMAQDFASAFGQKNPTLGGFQAIDVGDAIGKLAIAVKALDERTAKAKT